MKTVDQFFRDFMEGSPDLSEENYSKKQIEFMVNSFAQSYAQYVLENGGIPKINDWLPIDSHPVEFTRLVKEGKCLILYDNGQELPADEDAPFALSTHFKEI